MRAAKAVKTVQTQGLWVGGIGGGGGVKAVSAGQPYEGSAGQFVKLIINC